VRSSSFLTTIVAVLTLGCSRQIAPSDTGDASQSVDRVSPSYDVMSAIDVPTSDAADGGPFFDPRDSGRCDPRRVHARNTGQICWNREPETPGFDCMGLTGFTCQEGVCCSGRINPDTCDCDCPDVDGGICDEPGSFRSVVCCLGWGEHQQDPQIPACWDRSECFNTRAYADSRARRDQ
jgi:hypothetical protein